MKRTIGIILLSIANLVILAHTVIPHNQENSYIHSCSFLCHNPISENDEFATNFELNVEHNGHQHSNEEHHDCLLDDLSIRFEENNQIIQAENLIAYTLLDFFTQVVEFISLEASKQDLQFTHKIPNSIPLYVVDISHSVGLRAPPAC